MSAAAAEACREVGLATVYWSAWGLDWENFPPARIAEVAGEQIDDGGIMLLHDSAVYGQRPSALPTAEAIPLIAEWTNTRGLALTSLGDALASLSPIVGDAASPATLPPARDSPLGPGGPLAEAVRVEERLSLHYVLRRGACRCATSE